MKKYLITGLLIWIPLAITLWVLHLIVSSMDQVLTLLPPQLQPETLFGRQIPGLGLVLTVVVVFLTGLFASNIIGERLLRLWEGILRRIPVVNSIYIGVKQVSDTLFRPGEVPLLGDVAALTTRTIAAAFRVGIQLSAPFLVFGLLFNLGLGVLSRLMPQMQVFFVGIPLSILVGFLILLLVVGAMMAVFLGSVETVLRALAPHS